ncbi:MAG: hypothetical protein QOJ69_567 [Actinomycetota bacterium]|jgi:hypothetical protein|nr:hypothetical protein [Actinomycetota bacterium]
MQSDHDRRELYLALHDLLGPGPTGTLMELLPPVGWTDLARQSDLVAIRGEMTGLRGEMAELRAELKGEMAEMRAEMARMNTRIDAQIPKLIWANVPVMASLAGLVLATVKLA